MTERRLMIIVMLAMWVCMIVESQQEIRNPWINIAVFFFLCLAGMNMIYIEIANKDQQNNRR